MAVYECSPYPPGVWHRTRMLGRRGWVTVGHALGRRSRVFADSTFAGLMAFGYYVEFGWK